MSDTAQTRSVIGTFFKESSGRLRLDSLEVIRPIEGRTHYGYDTYDVDYSKTYGYIFHMSGCGGRTVFDVSGIYFVSGEVRVNEVPSTFVQPASRQRNKTRKLRRLPQSFDLQPGQDLLDWLERNGIDSDTVWCSICRDRLPESDLCEHTWWCDRTSSYSTPDDRCKCANRAQCRDDDVEEELSDAV